MLLLDNLLRCHMLKLYSTGIWNLSWMLTKYMSIYLKIKDKIKKYSHFLLFIITQHSSRFPFSQNVVRKNKNIFYLFGKETPFVL